MAHPLVDLVLEVNRSARRNFDSAYGRTPRIPPPGERTRSGILLDHLRNLERMRQRIH